MSVIDELVAAINEAGEIKPVEHPQYIEGALYVTPEQYKAFKVLDAELPFDYTSRLSGSLMPAAGIPVIVVYPGRPVDLPSGKKLAYVGGNDFIEFDPAKVDDFVADFNGLGLRP